MFFQLELTARRSLIQNLKELEFRFKNPEIDIFAEMIAKIAEKSLMLF
jgi:hypothetical protein